MLWRHSLKTLLLAFMGKLRSFFLMAVNAMVQKMIKDYFKGFFQRTIKYTGCSEIEMSNLCRKYWNRMSLCWCKDCIWTRDIRNKKRRQVFITYSLQDIKLFLAFCYYATRRRNGKHRFLGKGQGWRTEKALHKLWETI